MPKNGIFIKRRPTLKQRRLSNFAISYTKGYAHWRDKTTGEVLTVSLDQSRRIRSNIEKYRSVDQIRKSLSWASTYGDEWRKIKAVENMNQVLDSFGIDQNDREALIKAFESLSDEERVRFWQENDNLMRQTYNYYRDLVKYGPEEAQYGFELKTDEKGKPQSISPMVSRSAYENQSEIVGRLWNALSRYGRYPQDFM